MSENLCNRSRVVTFAHSRPIFATNLESERCAVAFYQFFFVNLGFCVSNLPLFAKILAFKRHIRIGKPASQDVYLNVESRTKQLGGLYSGTTNPNGQLKRHARS